MKTTDFADYLSRYLARYLPNERGVSPCTIDSYRYAFSLYLEFIESVHGIKAVRITLDDFTAERITEFLDWLEKSKGCQAATRNLRLAALRGFAKYLQVELPERLAECQRIQSIPVKKAQRKQISYLKTDGVALLVKQFNRHATNGLRDLLILMLLYTVGLRVSELTAIRMGDLHLGSPAHLIVHGKGGKDRPVPLMNCVLPVLRQYLEGIDNKELTNSAEPLFKNHLGEQFYRRGINYLVKKYADKARLVDPTAVPANLSPHKLRHTTAMELLASGVELIYIRDLLGHSSVTTTEIYAKADSKAKREAIEKASRGLVPAEEAKWEANPSIKEWLKKFSS